MLNTLTLTEHSAEYALDKLRAFIKVNRGRDSEGKSEAIDLLCEAIGLDPTLTEYLQDKLIESFEANAGYAFVGIIMGVMMAEHSLENSSE